MPKNLKLMLVSGFRPNRDGTWLDVYNKQAYNEKKEWSGTILTGIDFRNIAFVVVEL